MERVIISSQEEQLIQIVQTLPAELMAKVVEFAESLQRQLNKSKSYVISDETVDLVHEDEQNGTDNLRVQQMFCNSWRTKH